MRTFPLRLVVLGLLVVSMGASVANNAGTALAAGPSITSVTPSAGPTTGGTVVTIIGTGLTGAFSVTFGGVVAPIAVVSDSVITVVNPAHAAGTVDVVVLTPAGMSSENPGAQFTYVGGLPVPSAKDDCKKDGWMSLGRTNGTTFKNQGDCVSYVSNGK